MSRMLFFITCVLLGLGTVSCNDLADKQKRQIPEVHVLRSQVNLRDSACKTDKSADQKDLDALTKLYRATGGSAWPGNINWLKGDPCKNEWYGVCCDSDGHVIELNLDFNQMTGPIPSEIFSMKSLEVMNFAYNQLNGSLPEKIMMPTLIIFNLTFNQISGSAPTTWDCPNLQVISLHHNMLKGSLPILSNLSHLVALDLSYNQFSGSLPTEYGSLTSLKQLELHDMAFEKANRIPSSWFKLKNLESLGIEMLYGELQQEMATSWPNLKYLIFSAGNLTGSIPSNICKLTNLTYLQIMDNPVNGTIPDCIGDLPNLEYFITLTTNISGKIPRSLGNSKHLRMLILGGSKLYGAIPSTLGSLNKTLTYLSLDDNKLSSIEDGLDPLFKKLGVFSCDLTSNPFPCPLPDSSKLCEVSACSLCNSEENRSSCSKCLGNQRRCGWCSESPSCFDAWDQRPVAYSCKPANWVYGDHSKCPN